MTWRNSSSDHVSDLWLHLYLNAFKNSRSTFSREWDRLRPGRRMAEGGWGWIEITSIRLAGGADLAAATSFEHPDDDNADDRSVVRVRLPEPVSPGAA